MVALVASPRRHGNTSVLVDAALEELGRRGVRVEKVMLGECRIGSCLGHEDCGERAACPLQDDAAALLDRVYAADGLILATPVYYENVSAQMKVFMDRNVFRYSHDEWLGARIIGLIVVTAETGLDDTFAALRRFLALSTATEVPVVCAGGLASSAGEAAADAKLMAAARRLGADVAGALTAPA